MLHGSATKPSFFSRKISPLKRGSVKKLTWNWHAMKQAFHKQMVPQYINSLMSFIGTPIKVNHEMGNLGIITDLRAMLYSTTYEFHLLIDDTGSAYLISSHFINRYYVWLRVPFPIPTPWYSIGSIIIISSRQCKCFIKVN